MNQNQTANKQLFSKKDTNAVKRQERFEKSKKYQKQCEVSLKLQEEYLKKIESK